MDTRHSDERIRAALSELPPHTIPKAAEEVTDFLKKESEIPVRLRDAVFPDPLRAGRYYAIHDDDLDLIKESAAIAAAIIAGLPDPLTVAGTLVLLLYKIRKKKIEITGTEALILMEIIRTEDSGTTHKDLVNFSRMNGISEEDFIQSLDHLCRARRHDGTPAPLVEEAAGRYFSLDV